MTCFQEIELTQQISGAPQTARAASHSPHTTFRSMAASVSGSSAAADDGTSARFFGFEPASFVGDSERANRSRCRGARLTAVASSDGLAPEVLLL